MGLLRSEAVSAYLDRARRAPVAAEARPEPMQASTSATSARVFCFPTTVGGDFSTSLVSSLV